MFDLSVTQFQNLLLREQLLKNPRFFKKAELATRTCMMVIVLENDPPRSRRRETEAGKEEKVT